MADEALARAGLHFDELNKIRVLEPEVAQQTVELKEECKEFVDSMYVNMSNGATVINYNKSIYLLILYTYQYQSIDDSRWVIYPCLE